MNKQIIVLFCMIAICLAQNRYCNESDRLTNGKVCSNKIEPVCAIRQCNLQGGQHQRTTFNNHCEACQNTSVLYVAQGPCEAYPANGQFCDPDTTQYEACTNDYTPVCGLVGTIFTLCQGGSCVQTYSNSCSACQSGSFFYTPGKCESTTQ